MTASSSKSGFGPARANDGSIDSFWESNDHSWPATITVDLGTNHTVTRVVLKVPWGGRDERIEVVASTDNSTWVTLVSESMYRLGTVTLSPSPQQARYVRLKISSNSASPAAQIGEFEVWGLPHASTATPTASPTASPTPTAVPYSGTAIALPGTICLPYFDRGGEGVAYHDQEAANQGGDFRVSEGVDIESSDVAGCSYNIGWTRAEEWLRYSVTVAASGLYDLRVLVGNPFAGGQFHIEVDGVNVSGTLTVPNTGQWWTWQTVTKTGVNLTAGGHALKLVMDRNTSDGWVGNFATLTVAAAATSTPTVTPTATSTPTPTGTPTTTPPSGTIFEAFDTCLANWGMIGNVSCTTAGTNKFMTMQVPAGGSVEAWKNVSGAVLASCTGIRLTVNLNSATLLGSDASALYLDQGGWKYISLSSYVTQGQSGWQTVNVPLSAFSGFNKAAAFSRLGFRFWHNAAKTIGIDDVVLTGCGGASPTPTATSTATPAATVQTITFDDRPGQDQALDGQYPSGVIDWGIGTWWHSEPWEQFTTKSMSYNGPNLTSASFTFVTPRRLLQLDAYNGGTNAATVTLSCGSLTKSVSIPANTVVTVVTGWSSTCTTVTITSSTGWNVNFDNIQIAVQ
jgi:hypothetical protein